MKEKKDAAAMSAFEAEAGGNEKEKSAALTTDNIFISDECGDTLWDAVLAQEDKKHALQKAINNIQSS